MPEQYRETTGETAYFDTDEEHRQRCSGFTTPPDDDNPKPCLRCKPHLRGGPVSHNDYPESTPSFRAADAIRRADAKDRRDRNA